ncbi:AraC family transcriptional regulator [Flavobacterium sp.]|uniref:helix-turn-helix domain-containing protein n=1 Tax=Flavobacterium sp. TaxID=239 RepID=UPI00286EC783|nr:AraC family transcriptional regulator [Flavobacterium sp.]
MLLYLSIFTILISFVLLYHNWGLNKNAIYLTFVFILTSIFGIAHYLITSGGSRFWLAIFYNNFAALMFLIGPFLYFYIRNTLTDRYSLSKKDWLHFIPTLIAFIGSVPYIFQSFDKKLEIADKIIQNPDIIEEIDVNIFYTMGQSFVFRCSIAFLYLIGCIYLLWKLYPSETKEKQIPKNQLIITYRWLIILITNLSFIFVSFILLAISSEHSVPSKTINDGQVLYIIAGLAYSIMSFSLILFPEILYGIPRRNEAVTPKKKKVKNKIAPEEDPFFDMYKAILKYLEEEKPFLNPDFSVSDIALYLKAPQNHVSYCITYLMETKFSKLKSALRIKHALELLKKGSNSLLTIEAIGKQSGFKTRSNFYAAFKEETGFTPTEYINNEISETIR